MIKLNKSLFFFVFSFFISCSLSFSSFASSVQYYTASDVDTYNAAYNDRLNYIVSMRNSAVQFGNASLVQAIDADIAKAGSLQNLARNMALSMTGYPEVPVEGAQRSDYVAPPVTDPVPDPEPEPDDGGGSGLPSPGTETLADILSCINLVFKLLRLLIVHLITEILSIPIMFIPVSLGFGFYIITMFQKLR